MSSYLQDQDAPERDGFMPGKKRARPSISLSTVLAAALALVSVAACASEEASPPPAEPAPVPYDSPEDSVEGTDADPDYDPREISIIAVDIDTRLAIMCGLEQSKVFFTFDSAKLSPAAKERIAQIATCSKTGPIKGQALLVVGRTDPVGTDAYNDLLGMSRADSVARYLGAQGVDKTLIVTESKGEDAAEESFPGNWPYDRRVTVRLESPPDTEPPAQ